MKQNDTEKINDEFKFWIFGIGRFNVYGVGTEAEAEELQKEITSVEKKTVKKRIATENEINEHSWRTINYYRNKSGIT